MITGYKFFYSLVSNKNTGPNNSTAWKMQTYQ